MFNKSSVKLRLLKYFTQEEMDKINANGAHNLNEEQKERLNACIDEEIEARTDPQN